MRESGRAFLSYFQAHEEREEKRQEVWKAKPQEAKEHWAMTEEIQRSLEELEGSDVESDLNKVTKLRKKLGGFQRRAGELFIERMVIRLAMKTGFIQYCQVAENVIVLNDGRDGNDSLMLMPWN